MTTPTKDEAIAMAIDAGANSQEYAEGVYELDKEELHALVTAAYARGVADIADWIEPQRNDVPATGAEFAAAIRNRSAS